VNSRFALETAELLRAQKGDGEAGAFCHDVSRAFFTEHADISKREVIVPIAERFGISASDVETAWHERRFSSTVDAFIEDGHKVGVRGVPAMGWPNRRAVVGMMPPTELVLRLRDGLTQEFLAAHPDDYYAHGYLGYIYPKMRDLAHAEEYSRSYELWPSEGHTEAPGGGPKAEAK